MDDRNQWDGQVARDYADMESGTIYENADPLTAGEPDAFPRFLTEPANPEAPTAAPAPHIPVMRGVGGGGDPVATELRLLEQIRDGSLGGSTSLAVVERAPQSATEIDYPVPGVKRWLLPRVAVGGAIAVPITNWTRVLAWNASRIGGTITNSGTKTVILALDEPANVTPVTARIFLGAEGGAWDMRLGNLLWGGSVSAMALEAESQLLTVEV